MPPRSPFTVVMPTAARGATGPPSAHREKTTAPRPPSVAVSDVPVRFPGSPGAPGADVRETPSLLGRSPDHGRRRGSRGGPRPGRGAPWGWRRRTRTSRRRRSRAGAGRGCRTASDRGEGFRRRRRHGRPRAGSGRPGGRAVRPSRPGRRRPRRAADLDGGVVAGGTPSSSGPPAFARQVVGMSAQSSMTVTTTSGSALMVAPTGSGRARWTSGSVPLGVPSTLKWVGMTAGGCPGRPLTTSCPKSWPSPSQARHSSSSRAASQGWVSRAGLRRCGRGGRAAAGGRRRRG